MLGEEIKYNLLGASEGFEVDGEIEEDEEDEMKDLDEDDDDDMEDELAN